MKYNWILLCMCLIGIITAPIGVAQGTPHIVPLSTTHWLGKGKISSFDYPFSTSHAPATLLTFDAEGANSVVLLSHPQPHIPLTLSIGLRIDSRFFPCPSVHPLTIHFPYNDVTVPPGALACLQGGTVLKPDHLFFQPDIQHKGLFATLPLSISQNDHIFYISALHLEPFSYFISRLLGDSTSP